MSLSERLEPGTRLLLLLNADNASLTEAVALWPVSEGDWILMAPDGELAICDVNHVAFAAAFTDAYPEYDDSKSVTQFRVPLTDAELKDFMKTAQRQAAESRRGRPTPVFPTRAGAYGDADGRIHGKGKG